MLLLQSGKLVPYSKEITKVLKIDNTAAYNNIYKVKEVFSVVLDSEDEEEDDDDDEEDEEDEEDDEAEVIEEEDNEESEEEEEGGEEGNQ